MVPPKLASRLTLRRPSSASPVTLGLRFRTTANSPEQLERELRLVSAGPKFQHVSCASLAASAGLLSSVIAFNWLACYLELSAKMTGCQDIRLFSRLMNNRMNPSGVVIR